MITDSQGKVTLKAPYPEWEIISKRVDFKKNRLYIVVAFYLNQSEVKTRVIAPMVKDGEVLGEERTEEYKDAYKIQQLVTLNLEGLNLNKTLEDMWNDLNVKVVQLQELL